MRIAGVKPARYACALSSAICAASSGQPQQAGSGFWWGFGTPSGAFLNSYSPPPPITGNHATVRMALRRNLAGRTCLRPLQCLQMPIRTDAYAHWKSARERSRLLEALGISHGTWPQAARRATGPGSFVATALRLLEFLVAL